MEIILVRHAQPGWVDDNGASVLNPKLTELGLEQAARFAAHAEDWTPPTEVFVSPTRRTKQTAAAFQRRVGSQLTNVDWLEEIRVPLDWEGAPADRVSEALRKARHRPVSEWWSGYGGEPFADFYARITDGMREVLADRGLVHTQGDPPSAWSIEDGAENHRLLFFGHGGSNSVITAFLLGLDPVPWEWERFQLMHASVTRLRARRLAGGHIFSLQLLGDVSFLPKILRSR